MEYIPAVILGGGVFVMSLFKSSDDNNDDNHEKEKIIDKEDPSIELSKSAYDFYTAIDDLDVVSIVSKLHTKQFKKPSYKKQKYHTMEKSDSNVEFVDMSREYKDLCTNIVTNHFFSTDESLFNFLTLICETYYTALETYKQVHKLKKWDIFFIYKGGNILRIISNDFMDELPHIASKILKTTYEKYFTRSDCDFAIYIKDDLDNYETIFQDVTTLSYLLQVRIKTILISNPTKYFDFYKYNKCHQQQILEKYLVKMKESDGLKDPLNTKFYDKQATGLCFKQAIVGETELYKGRVDFGIQEMSDQSGLAIYALCNTESELYITINETLDFYGITPESRGKFNLIRTKVAFNMYFNGTLYQIGGELIDVSVNHKFDYKLIEMYRHIDNMASCVNKYTMTFKEQQLDFLSYSLEHLIYDLELILFVEHLPWADRKYEKRLNRLFYLYIVNLFTNVKDIKVRKEIITSLLTVLTTTTITVSSFDTDKSEMITKLNGLNFSKKLAIYSVVTRLTTIIKTLMITNLNDFNGVITTIIKNCISAIEIINKINKYCNIKGKVSYQSLYNPDFSTLIGGGVVKDIKGIKGINK